MSHSHIEIFEKKYRRSLRCRQLAIEFSKKNLLGNITVYLTIKEIVLNLNAL